MTNGNDKAFAEPTITTIHAVGETETSVDPNGLSKREFFAAMAMQGLMANPYDPADITIQKWAKQAVLHADALIDALNKEISTSPPSR